MNFSVLMSVYSKEKAIYLDLALESILKQTKKPDQIVLVKDGFLTRELERVIDYYVIKQQSLFKIVALNENKGLGVALNEGIKECKHELIARMDSDDICAPERFEKQISMFEKNPELDIIGSYINEFESSSGEIISIRKVPLSDSDIKSFAKKRNPLNHMTVIFKKTAVMKAGGYKDFMWFEDYYLWVRMILNNCLCANIDESLVDARTGDLMFERRGGREYAKMEFLLQKEFLKLRFTNHSQFLVNIIIRVLPRCLPTAWMKKMYLSFVRQ